MHVPYRASPFDGSFMKSLLGPTGFLKDKLPTEAPAKHLAEWHAGKETLSQSKDPNPTCEPSVPGVGTRSRPVAGTQSKPGVWNPIYAR